jgi:hypothetical protein
LDCPDIINGFEAKTKAKKEEKKRKKESDTPTAKKKTKVGVDAIIWQTEWTVRGHNDTPFGRTTSDRPIGLVTFWALVFSVTIDYYCYFFTWSV